MKKCWQISLVATWAIAMIVLMYLLAQNNQVNFDPDGRLMLASMSLDFDSQVIDAFYPIQQQTKGTVFHLTDENCGCNPLSRSHIRKLDKLFMANRFTVHTVDLAQYPTLASIIPSIPAIIIFDQQGGLGYLGPYSSGFFCSPNTSMIETVADSIIHNRHIGATVISDSTGCYCRV
ncbi:MAG: DUF6436 domain-containing protein [Pseudomonadota bacterium]